MEVKEAIITATAIIEKGWTQGAAARDSSGEPVGSGSPKVVTCCAIGALFRVFYLHENISSLLSDESLDVLEAAIRAVEKVIPRDELGCKVKLSEHNDEPGRTQADMVSLFKTAA